MPEPNPTKDEQLFVYLISMFSESAWIALGKTKNPATDHTEKNLYGASLYIDLLDLIKTRMSGNLSEHELQFVESTISNLKLNYMEEVKKSEKEESEAGEEKGEEKTESKDSVEKEE